MYLGSLHSQKTGIIVYYLIRGSLFVVSVFDSRHSRKFGSIVYFAFVSPHSQKTWGIVIKIVY